MELRGKQAIRSSPLVSHVCLGYTDTREHDPISFVCWYTLQHHLKTNMNSARSLNTLDHQREAARDSCRKSNYPSGNTWLSTQLGELPAEHTGQGELLPRTMAAAFLCYFHFSYYTFHFFLLAIYKLVVGCLLLQKKHTYDNLIIVYIRKSCIVNCRQVRATLQRDIFKSKGKDDFLCEGIN